MWRKGKSSVIVSPRLGPWEIGLVRGLLVCADLIRQVECHRGQVSRFCLMPPSLAGAARLRSTPETNRSFLEEPFSIAERHTFASGISTARQAVRRDLDRMQAGIHFSCLHVIA